MNAPIVDHFIKEKDKKIEQKNKNIEQKGIEESESLKALRLLAQSTTYHGMSEVHKDIIKFTQPARNISIVTSALSLTVVILGILVLLAKSFFIDMGWSENNGIFYLVVSIIALTSFYLMIGFVRGVENIKQTKGDAAVKSFALRLTTRKKDQRKFNINLAFLSAFFITASMIYMSYSGAVQIGDYAKSMQIDKEAIANTIKSSSAYKVIENSSTHMEDETMNELMNSEVQVKLAQMIEDGIKEKEAPINRTVWGFLVLAIAVEIVAILAPIFLYHILKSIPEKERNAVIKAIYKTDKKVLNVNNKIEEALIDQKSEKVAKKHGINLSSRVVDIRDSQAIVRALYKEGSVKVTTDILADRRLESIRKIFTSSIHRDEVMERIIRPLVSANYIEKRGNLFYAIASMDRTLKALQPKEVQK